MAAAQRMAASRDAELPGSDRDHPHARGRQVLSFRTARSLFARHRYRFDDGPHAANDSRQRDVNRRYRAPLRTHTMSVGEAAVLRALPPTFLARETARGGALRRV